MQIKAYVEPQGIPVYFEYQEGHSYPMVGDFLYIQDTKYEVISRAFSATYDSRLPIGIPTLYLKTVYS